MSKSTWFKQPLNHWKYCAHDHSNWTLTRRRLSWLKILWRLGAGGQIIEKNPYLIYLELLPLSNFICKSPVKWNSNVEMKQFLSWYFLHIMQKAERQTVCYFKISKVKVGINYASFIDILNKITFCWCEKNR